MGKATLIALLGFSALFTINTYSQSPKDEIPEPVREAAVEYLTWIPYCLGEPIIEKVGEKLEDRTSQINTKDETGIKDGIKDKITLYHLMKKCEFFNISNYIIYTQIGLKNGGFLEKGKISHIISRDENAKSIPLTEKW